MIICPGCGLEAPDDFVFCSRCGTELSSPPVAPAPAVEERKTVTTLFCDLVGFTALGEAADPEDVAVLLREYSDRARKVIESHGGTVEKFIGDAVVGVFGVPAVHEDDPERAVRAGLRLVEALEGMTRPDGSALQARIGINTGEALARLDIDPSSGRGFLTGDAVNTAARLQAAAPPDGVSVGALTHELTTRTIEYEELPPVTAKGKAERVAAWLAKAALARRGIDALTVDLTPLQGRDVELSYLSAIFDKAVGQSLPQFALIVGESGIGKSRLVHELLNIVDARPQMTTWRQGYCPPFGEDITYWALAEVVKGHAGIRDTDDVVGIEAKLDAVLPSGPDREWFRQRLRALVGLVAPDASREENFTAWMRFFEDVAAGEPTVLVFEDLHWADDALLAFIEYMTTHAAYVPLLIVGTARPELFEAHPGFASGGRVNRIELGPLSPAETARLVAGLLTAPGGWAEAVDQIVERCEGNPFYAEQSVRLLRDSALNVQVPESVQAVIAARLDTLPADEKALLGDAAVVGSVFWDGALAAMRAREPQELQQPLSGLLERQLIRRVREPALAGEREFTFVHALARDVVYGRLPRVARAEKHAAVAAWLETRAGTRRDELIEVIAHHSATALELARVAGRNDLAASLTEQAVRDLTLAGDRGLRLDVASAERQYARAIALLPARHSRRPQLLRKWGEALVQLGDLEGSARAFAEAADGFTETGDVRAAAAATVDRAGALVALGDAAGPRVFYEALAVLEADGPSPELVVALEGLAAYRAVSDDSRSAVDIAERALAMATELGLPEPITALHFRGIARCDLGDAGGLADLQRALAAAEDRGSAADVARFHFNLGAELWLLEGAAAVLDIRRKGLDFAERRGQKAQAQVSSAGLVGDLVWAGDWDGASALALETDRTLETMGYVHWLVTLRSERALLSALCGDAVAAQAIAVWIHEQSCASQEPEELLYSAFTQAVVRDVLADAVGTRAALSAYEGRAERRVESDYALRLPLAVRAALRAEDVPLAERLAARVRPSLPLYSHALASVRASMAAARGKHETAASGFAGAAARWHDFGVPYEEAQALLGEGRCLVALGRGTEATEPLAAAREIFERLGAKPALEETDELLKTVSSASQA
jgi:class 3 adenylate cyclase/tetratricopeptide (TPR) repeat protein